jgi:hypothetical protein
VNLGKRKKIYSALVFIVFVICAIFYFVHLNFRSQITFVRQQDGPIIVQGLTNEGDIPPINNPKFEDVASADQYLNDDGLGLLVKFGRRARFYPFQILVWHEAVNDVFEGKEILVSFSPLTFTSGVYLRTINGTSLEFSVSGKVSNSNTLLIDSLGGSLWEQASGEASDGAMKGSKLERIKSAIVSWSDFKKIYPNSSVLSRETGVERDYTQDPYAQYAQNSDIWFLLSSDDSRLPAKTLIYGTIENGEPVAYTQNAFLKTHDVFEPSLFMSSYWFYWAALHPDTKIAE